jgi:hypothetical protein
LLAHLLKSAVRSLAVTVVLGCILVYATGGLDSPNARGMIGVIAICFFLFWVTFFFMFGPRVPKHDSRRKDRDLDETSPPLFRLRKRHEDGEGGEAGENGESGSDD